MNKGILAGLSAFFLWGILPVYWKALKLVPSMEILCHRILWSLVFLMIVIHFRHQKSWYSTMKANPKHGLIYLASSFLISVNWFIYIWSVNAGYIVESSLGYFINPLVNVVLGVVFLRESLRRGQWVAVGLAAIGVIWMTWQYGQVPWIALTLAFSFGSYGLIRKMGPLHALNGLAIETTILLPPVLSYLVFLEVTGRGSFLNGNFSTIMLLLGAGLVTAIPLVLFATAVKLVQLSTVGIMQYLAPTLQLLVGVLIYHEDFSPARFQGFLIIWIALIIYSADSLVAHRSKRIYLKKV